MLKVVLVGRPNVGKSTLFNRLVRSQKAIVNDQPGVTRDRKYAQGKLVDLEFTLIDTAGIRKGYKYNHKVEYFSFIRALHAVEKSDIVIFLCDANESLVDQDLKILNIIIDAGKPILFAFNKIDLLSKQDLLNLYQTKKMQS